MIPHKLQLKNFLSYGSTLQTIDFCTYQLICLSGKNGHGKSALLDAMTWAVWGQARKTLTSVKADQGLLRLGQTQMMVIFDFECNAHQYRIRREYMQTYGKPYSVLEFGIIDKATGNLIALTDKTIKATQEKIEHTLRLDFESFINSAFLRQGNANEFSKKSSKERKEILATILGLNQYETIRKSALNKIKQAHIQEHTLKALQEKAITQLATKDAISNQLEMLAQQTLNIKQEETILFKEKESITRQQHEIALAQQKIELYGAQIKELELHAMHEQEALKKNLSAWRTTRTHSKKLPEITQLEIQKRDLLNQMHHHQKILQERLEIKTLLLQKKELLHAYEQSYKEHTTHAHQVHASLIERLYNDQRSIVQHITTLEKERTSITQELSVIEQKQTDLEQQISPKEILQHDIALHESALEKRKEIFGRLVAHGNMLKINLKELIQKQHLTNMPEDPSCPLCEQNLSAARRKFIKQKFNQQERLFAHQIARLNKVIPTAKQMLITKHTALLALKKEYETTVLRLYTFEEQKKVIVTLMRKHKELNSALQELSGTLNLINEEIKKQELQLITPEQLHTNLIKNETYQQLLLEHNDVQKKLESWVYNEQMHTETIARIRHIEEQITLHTDLLQELNNQPHRAERIAQHCIQLKMLKIKKQSIERTCLEYMPLVATQDTLQIAQKNLVERLTAFNNRKDYIMQEITRLKTEENNLKLIELEAMQLKEQALLLATLIDDYQTIAHATGKDGIQALLIEDAIPEIEHEANSLLSKLTNNQSHILIESLRDLKNGGTKETLDIKISDAAGIRPYELFSGGEGFRIDFALRIAISKLLARRAGTALQTLIIDEGFGSQDEEGLSHIMDAIHKIQDDFARIIIVSHLPALKDQFPVHFIVEKGPQGSMVTVQEYD